jgi:hypothetical protein
MDYRKVDSTQPITLTESVLHRPEPARRRTSLLSALGESGTVKGYFSPKLNTFFVVMPDPVKE